MNDIIRDKINREYSICFIVHNEIKYRDSNNLMILTGLIGGLNTVGLKCIEVFEHQLESKLDEIDSNSVVLFFGSFLHSLTTRDGQFLLKMIRGIKVSIGWDDEYQYRWTLAFAANMHHVFTYDLFTLEYLRQLGISVSLCPHPLPPIVKTKDKINYRYDVSFIGRVSLDKPDRYKFLKKIEAKHPKSFFPGLSGEHIDCKVMHETFRFSKINLNLTGVSDFSPDWPLPFQAMRRGYKGRPLEIGACGGFCLSEVSPSIEHFFDGEGCIDFFEDVDQCLELIHYYLSNASERINKAARLENFTKKNILSNSPSNLFGHEILNLIKKFGSGALKRPFAQESRFTSTKLNLEPSFEVERLKNMLKERKIGNFISQVLFLYQSNFFRALTISFKVLISISRLLYRKIK